MLFLFQRKTEEYLKGIKKYWKRIWKWFGMEFKSVLEWNIYVSFFFNANFAA